MKCIITGFLVSFISVASLAQSAGDYRSRQTGNWTTVTTWQVFDGGSWVNLEIAPGPYTNVIPGTASGEINIDLNTIVTISTQVSADQLTVSSGGSLVISQVGELILFDGVSSDDLVIGDASFGEDENGEEVFIPAGSVAVESNYSNGVVTQRGILENRGVINGNSGNLAIDGTYEHNQSGGTVASATWGNGSTTEITGNSTAPVNGLGQTFYDFIWNPSAQTGSRTIIANNMSLNLGFAVVRNFEVRNTNASTGGAIALTTSFAQNFTIPGDLIISGNSRLNLSTSAATTVTVNGNLVNSATGNGTISLRITQSGVGASLTVLGNITVTGNSLIEMVEGAASVGTATLDARGNIALDLAAIRIQSTSASSNGFILFNGTGTQNVTRNVASTTGFSGSRLTYTVGANSTTNIGQIALPGLAFTLNGTIGLGSLEATGALQTSTTLGNIRVSGTRTYTNNSTIVYNGTGLQRIGTGHPSSTTVNCLIANSSGLTMVGNVTISGALTQSASVSGSNLSLNGFQLTLNGAYTPNSNSLNIASNASSLVLDGGNSAGAIANLPFSGGSELRNFTINRGSNTITLGSNLAIGSNSFTGSSAVFTQTGGNLNIGSNTFQLFGNYGPTTPGGNITSAAGSLSFSGSGSMPTSVALSGTFANLTHNRTTTLTTGSSITVTNLNLQDGTVSGSGIAMALGGTISRASTSSVLTTAPSGGPYNLNYNGGSFLNAGNEFQNHATRINNVTIGNSATLGLLNNVIVNGNLISTGGFEPGSNTVTLAGNLSASSGTYSNSTFIFNGTSTISGAPTFGSITVNASRSLTLPSGDFSFDGDLQIDATSTFNASATNLVLTGSTNQQIAAGGKTFTNITVQKTGSSDVLLSAPLFLTGILDVQSAGTDFSSNGNLTLVSTATSTAYIAQLPNLPSDQRRVSGDVNFQRYVAAAGRLYRDISAPVTNGAVSEIIASGLTVTGNFTGSSFPCSGCVTNSASMFTYNEPTQAYVAFPTSGGNSSQTLATGRGYNLLVRNEVGSPTVTLSGPINSGTISFPSSLASSGWNLLGNPYPSAIDWDNVTGWSGKANIQGSAVYVYDPLKSGTGAFRFWTGVTGDLSGGVIAPGQGFWVQLTGSSSFGILEAAKVTSSATFYRTKDEPVSDLMVTVSGQDFEDNAFLQILEGAGEGFDHADVSKLLNPRGASFSFLTVGEKKVALQAIGKLPGNPLYVPVTLDSLKPGVYNFNFRQRGEFEGVPLYVTDRLTGSVHSLDATGWSFVVNEKNMDQTYDRFTLIVGRVEVVTSIIEEVSNSFTVYPNPVVSSMKVAYLGGDVQPEVELINNMGSIIAPIVMVKSDGVWSGEADMTSQSGGVYFVRMKCNGAVKVLKFVKK